MAYEIRQLSFGEILDESFKVLKDHFKVLVGASAVLYIPYNVVSGLLMPTPEPGVPPDPSLGGSLAMIMVSLLFLIVVPLTQLAVTRAVAAAYLDEPMELGDAYRGARKMFSSYLGTFMLVGLAGFGALLLFVIPGVYLFVCWALVGPVLVVEGLSGRAAMKRSRALVKGYWWRSFGIYFTVGILGAIVGFGVQAVVGAIPVLGTALSGAVQSVTAAFGQVAVVVMYTDLRCRSEDFDLQRLASAVLGSAPAQVPVPAEP